MPDDAAVITLQPLVLEDSYPSLVSVIDARFFQTEVSIVPHGLQCLQALDMVLLEQMAEEGDKLPGMELDNQYVLKNSNHQPILLASENTGFCCRCFFAAARAFEVNVYDDRGNRVINIERRFTFGLCCICGICCGNKVEVTHASGETLGNVRHICSLTAAFEVTDPQGEALFIVRGPSYKSACCKVTFKIYTIADQLVPIGHITKEWGGIVKESFSDIDSFGITFPKQLRPEMKAVLIGCAFLIDFTYFER